MIVTCLTGGWNCEKLLPYFLRHYVTFCDKIIFYDWMSDDRTEEIAKACPIVEFRELGVPLYIDSPTQTEWSNNIYKEFRGKTDWMMLPTTDEFLYSKEGMRNVLQDYFDRGVTVPVVVGYNMFHDAPPDTDKQLYEVYKMGAPHGMYNKRLIFHPDLEMNYCHGMHWCGPEGNVVVGDEHEILLLHYRYWGNADMLELHQRMWDKCSQLNKDTGMGGYNPHGDGFHSAKWWEKEKINRKQVLP